MDSPCICTNQSAGYLIESVHIDKFCWFVMKFNVQFAVVLIIGANGFSWFFRHQLKWPAKSLFWEHPVKQGQWKPTPELTFLHHTHRHTHWLTVGETQTFIYFTFFKYCIWRNQLCILTLQKSFHLETRYTEFQISHIPITLWNIQQP